ncbi:MAG: DUF1566 domain-containing protein, partial [Alphaproteobacteria bacterium]
NPATFAPFDTGCRPGCTVTTCSCTRSDYYWSSSTAQFNPSYAWYVPFYYGSDYYATKTNGFYVRAVRGGS